ncbi:hypothetical protein Pedsa_3135 [Pseudopedobacter saltans DSM 12145]|uniref:Uncharacterized protein n=1 Tax=Pseudopedobacter saltans (strain ATCC 51119 / DSM 12145 / JCM 21818 / CCUG 39354 / LMG 10337 / NBRC 100064 / NCIMB 13643) TaxID=762903 RepID=F0SAQ2_PSESL|nr:hypothetical protein [Pseudopedobacter saltans]ADY53673.1 hypothetical protein Pedsa_3135 [Pseudopedobacter saltans DSM 12145]
MKKYFKQLTIVIFALASLSIASCKKDNPVPETDQEEFDKTVLTFVELEADGNHELGTALTVTFDATGKPDKSHYHLTVGHAYRMYISLYSKGELVNDEILADVDLHQFFFTGAPNGVLNYTYEDNIGLKGVFEVMKENPTFTLNLILRHGIRKSNPLLPWNSPRSEYVKAGGADDLNVSFDLATGENH